MLPHLIFSLSSFLLLLICLILVHLYNSDWTCFCCASNSSYNTFLAAQITILLPNSISEAVWKLWYFDYAIVLHRKRMDWNIKYIIQLNEPKIRKGNIFAPNHLKLLCFMYWLLMYCRFFSLSVLNKQSMANRACNPMGILLLLLFPKLRITSFL